MVKTQQSYLKALDLNRAAEIVATETLLQVPPLVTPRSLSDATAVLARETLERFSAGYRPVAETITMPKHGLGPRPVTVMSPQAGTLYQAIVQSLAPELGEPTRSRDYSEHEEFGLDRTDFTSRIVDIDIAACYEYIDHEILAEEILLQTLDSDGAGALKCLLGEVFPRRVGLPQAQSPSHILADAYLAQVERDLVRCGYVVHRYADDFRIVAGDWGEAHDVIERASEFVRARGLTLSDGKTTIRSMRQAVEAIDERTAEEERFRNAAADSLRSIDLVTGYDGDIDFEEVEADDEEIDYAALAQIIEDWANGSDDASKRAVLSHLGAKALIRLGSAPDPVNWKSLVDVSEREPVRLRSVIQYLGARPEVSDVGETLCDLVQIPRQSPWARLWMLHGIDEYARKEPWVRTDLLGWATSLLADRHEVVRVEAAWVLAGMGGLPVDRLAELYIDATDVSRAGIAAVAGRLGAESKGPVSAIINDSRMNRESHKWGLAHAN